MGNKIRGGGSADGLADSQAAQDLLISLNEGGNLVGFASNEAEFLALSPDSEGDYVVLETEFTQAAFPNLVFEAGYYIANAALGWGTHKPFPQSTASGVSADFRQELKVGSDGLPLQDNLTLVFRHVIAPDNLFIDNSDALEFDASNPQPRTSTKFSILNTLENLRNSKNALHGLIYFPEIKTFIEWKQASNPTTSNTVTGYELIGTNFANAVFAGLALDTAGSGFLDGNPGSTSWWWSIGAQGLFNGGAPGPFTGVAAGSLTINVIEFYIVDEVVAATGDTLATATVADGVEVSAFPDYTTPEPFGLNQERTLNLGVNLLEVDTVVLHFERSNGDWPSGGIPFEVSDIKLNSESGGLAHNHFDDFMGFRDNTSAALAAGDVTLVSAGQAFTVTRIQFRKKADLLAERDLIYNSPTNTNTTNNNLLNGMTWQEVKDNYDKIAWSAKVGVGVYGGEVALAEFVDGDNIVGGMHSGLHFSISGLSFADGQFNFNTTNNTTNLAQFKIWGVRDVTISKSNSPPFLPITRDWVSYVDSTDGAFYQVIEYSNGVDSVWQQDDLSGVLTRISAIPSTYVLYEPLVPTLPQSNNVGHYWFDEDGGNFIMNPHADGVTLASFEVFLEDRPYGELQNVRFENNSPFPAGAYQFKTNPVTGLTNHLFTFTGPFNAGAGPGTVNADEPNPAGPQGGGANPPQSTVQTFAQ